MSVTGVKRFLVKTGKYQSGDEDAGEEPLDGVAEDFAGLVDSIIEGMR